MEKKYRAPKGKVKNFTKYWDLFLPKVTKRENFHESHLQQLEILCDLFVEYHTLSQFVKDNGYTYSSDSRYGKSIREHPECKLKDKIVSEIRAYSKMLDLVLAKDTGKQDTGKDEWD